MDFETRIHRISIAKVYELMPHDEYEDTAVSEVNWLLSFRNKRPRKMVCLITSYSSSPHLSTGSRSQMGNHHRIGAPWCIYIAVRSTTTILTTTFRALSRAKYKNRTRDAALKICYPFLKHFRCVNNLQTCRKYQYVTLSI